jgi:putative acetyltransferase
VNCFHNRLGFWLEDEKLEKKPTALTVNFWRKETGAQALKNTVYHFDRTPETANFPNMIAIVRTSSDHPEFRKLIDLLNAELARLYGEEQKFFDQFNKLNTIRHAVLATDDGEPVGTGAIREYAANTMEIKRMFVLPEKRGQGIATRVLKELETWSLEMKYTKCILETGDKLPDAVKLYQKNGYQRMPNYGQYAGVASSLCFEKLIGQSKVLTGH